MNFRNWPRGEKKKKDNGKLSDLLPKQNAKADLDWHAQRQGAFVTGSIPVTTTRDDYSPPPITEQVELTLLH